METLPVKDCKFRPMLGTQGLWAGKDLYRATPTVTRVLGFSRLIRRTAPFSRLLGHTRGCGGSILTRILTRTKAILLNHGPRGLDGANGNEMHIWYWKNISIWAKVSQVSDVAHEPLVWYCYISESIEKLLHVKKKALAVAFNSTFQYIADVW
jgi:hypothetical protein